MTTSQIDLNIPYLDVSKLHIPECTDSKKGHFERLSQRYLYLHAIMKNDSPIIILLNLLNFKLPNDQ